MLRVAQVCTQPRNNPCLCWLHSRPGRDRQSSWLVMYMSMVVWQLHRWPNQPCRLSMTSNATFR